MFARIALKKIPVKSRAKRARKLVSNAGFSIMEVMIALGILGISVGNTLGAVIQAQNFTSYQGDLNGAIRVATAQMEELFLLYSSDPDIQPGVHSKKFDAVGTPVVKNEKFTVEWTIIADSPIAKINKVVLNVKWKSGETPRNLEFVNFRN